MKLSKQEEYGLRCLLHMARDESRSFTIDELARCESLSSAYVGKLLRILRQGGLVKSTRGQKGGYHLVRPADVLSVTEALAALGGRLYSRDFCGRYTGHVSICVHDLDCSIRALMYRLDLAVQSVLGRTKLKDLLRSEQEMLDWVRTGSPAAAHAAPLTP